MEESWINIDHKTTKGRVIVAVSNKGRIKLSNGTIEESKYNTLVNRESIYRFIAKNFLITVRRPEQIYIDHISHNPIGMNINDVRNLRWCTIKENNSFEEIRIKMSESHKGKVISVETRRKISESMKGRVPWNKGIHCAEYTNHFNNCVKNQFKCTKEGGV